MVRKLCDSYGCHLIKVSRFPPQTRIATPCNRVTRHQVEFLIDSVLALRTLGLHAYLIPRP